MVDCVVLCVFCVKFIMGLFENFYIVVEDDEYWDYINIDEYKVLVWEIDVESIVFLENYDNVFLIVKDVYIVVIGLMVYGYVNVSWYLFDVYGYVEVNYYGSMVIMLFIRL